MKLNYTKFIEFIFKAIIKSAAVFLLLLVLAPSVVVASEIHFNPDSGNYKSETILPLEMILDTQDDKINVVSAEIALPRNVSVELSDGNSIISNWIETPSVTNGKIKFAGIIPGGYEGHDGTLLTLMITAPNGYVPIQFTSTPKVLLHDGIGTAAKASIRTANIQFSSSGQVINIDEDKDSPELFTVEITRNPSLFDNKFVAIFGTQDKGSGIDHYEILEGNSYNDTEGWQRVSSPYLLADQTLSKYVYVKAYDRAGNVRIASAAPAYVPPLIQRIIAPLLVILAVILMFTLWRILTHHQMIKDHRKTKSK